MEVTVYHIDNQSVACSGATYKMGLVDHKYKLIFEPGVLNPKAVKMGAKFLLTIEWLNHMIKNGKLYAEELK